MNSSWKSTLNVLVLIIFFRIFHDHKVLKKVIKTKTFNVDLHNKLTKVRLFCLFFYFLYKYIYIYIYIYIYSVRVKFDSSIKGKENTISPSKIKIILKIEKYQQNYGREITFYSK